jgi:predicted aldo/keto reductase-like oxidoreductase
MGRKGALTGSVSRRQFIITGGAAAAAGTLPRISAAEGEGSGKPRIQRHRTLGRTGFEVSDISIGGAGEDANLYRYAYDHGINYFDTAEGYANGDNERKIGEALQHMDRSKVFITTKLHLEGEVTEEQVLDRFSKCQERLRTDFVNGLFLHSVAEVSTLDHPGFHSAVTRLKADGRLRHAGVSCHGPRSDGEDSMSKVLCAAAADGRFDLMLLSYNFMNRDEGEKVLAACREHEVGTTAMKTAPGSVEIEPFDPDNPSKEYADYIARRIERGGTREEAVERIHEWIREENETFAETKPFMEEHGVTTKQDLQLTAVKWVLSNPDMHTACIGFRDFDAIDRLLPLSGTKLARSERLFLDRYRSVASSSYCRHGCIGCAAACPHAVPVSTIMRYAYYFTGQGREKLAMTKYARLAGRDGSVCARCSAPCAGACPHGVNVQAQVLRAHGLLRLA